ncbi:CHRD domain protein [Planctomycetes bacterium Poly30]|uniref:CHRD domain protein n=1 Tax=Saltatorellus ferox TaxID=2528018 RepID=A0A518ENX6_9BACT|nr:CHRD domain protein [Planctomycetes bacterium Poly30]
MSLYPRYSSTFFFALTLVSAASAQDRIAISIENLAPSMGTFQTPFWVGFHGGQFDLYDRGAPVSSPLERLAEDGATGFIASSFLASGAGSLEATIPGPNGPIAPGDRAFRMLLVNPMDPGSQFFAYASMVLPSNDAFVANGNPMAHPVYDAQGQFIFEDFIDADVLDAGSEVNDELPANTAFFGQMMPDTGTVEGGTVELHPGFLPAGSGGILDDFRYRNGQFTRPGYANVMIRMRRAPAITAERTYTALTNGSNVVPAVATPATARVGALLRENGTLLRIVFAKRNLENVIGAELRLGGPGENGPAVATVVGPLAPAGGSFGGDTLTMDVRGSMLTGPLADYPLDALSAELEAGNVYFLVRTSDGDDTTSGSPGDNPAGEIRGQFN